MINQNHTRNFRPLLGGVAISNPAANELGTLACILEDDRGEHWILSCYHVLGRPDFTDFTDGENVYQPSLPQNPDAIARLTHEHVLEDLDAIAAKITPGTLGTGNLLGIGRITGISTPQVGMSVLKSGAATGVTQGVITKVRADDIQVEPPTDFPSKYELTSSADSGALWVNALDRTAVGLHHSGHDTGGEKAFATRIDIILAFLSLSLCTH